MLVKMTLPLTTNKTIQHKTKRGESEAELDSETTSDEKFIRLQAHRQNILDFVNSLFDNNKKSQIKTMYSDLSVFLRVVAFLK